MFTLHKKKMILIRIIKLKERLLLKEHIHSLTKLHKTVNTKFHNNVYLILKSFFCVNSYYHFNYIIYIETMRFILFFFFLQCTSLLIAQNHVTWSFTFDNMNSNLVINGTIDEGWHLYSQKTPICFR